MSFGQGTFQQSAAPIWIASLDDGTTVTAQYNPKELQIDKTIAWQKHQKGNTDGLQYEFTGPDGRKMNVDMLFDGVEENAGVEGPVASLEYLATVRDASSTDPEMRRPHHCVVVWGTVMGGDDNRFQCVITSISVKYTMFSAGGQPLRATVTLQLQEATRVSMAASSDRQWRWQRWRQRWWQRWRWRRRWRWRPQRGRGW